MKTYIKPNTSITIVKLESQLLNISGNGDQLNGSSNGTYTENGGITLGTRRSIWDDDEK